MKTIKHDEEPEEIMPLKRIKSAKKQKPSKSNYSYFIKWAKETWHTPVKQIEQGHSFYETPSILKKNWSQLLINWGVQDKENRDIVSPVVTTLKSDTKRSKQQTR